MPIKIQQAYNVDPTKGDNLKDDDYIAFEEHLTDTTSNSWGAKLSQLVTYLRNTFYTSTEIDSMTSGYMEKVATPTVDYAVTQDATGGLKTAGVPLAIISMNTVPVSLWSQTQTVSAAHGLSVAPNFISVVGEFKADSNGWLTGDKIHLPLVGDATNASGFAITTTATNFVLYNSCANANSILIPLPATGGTDPVAVSDSVLKLELTFMSIT